MSQETLTEENAGYKIQPVPEWVIPLEYGCPEPAEDDFHLQEVLLDTQIHIPSSTHCYRFVRKILSQDGVQQITHFEVAFDPSYESLEINHIRKKRNDQWHEATDFSQAKIVQKEERLPEHRYSGKKTFLCFLKDVQIGDEIDIAYSIIGTNSIFEGRTHQIFWILLSTSKETARTKHCFLYTYLVKWV